MDGELEVSLESLASAYDVVTKLIEYYGTTTRVSLGQEGWIGLRLTLSVIEQAICETYGQTAWLDVADPSHGH